MFKRGWIQHGMDPAPLPPAGCGAGGPCKSPQNGASPQKAPHMWVLSYFHLQKLKQSLSPHGTAEYPTKAPTEAVSQPLPSPTSGSSTGWAHLTPDTPVPSHPWDVPKSEHTGTEPATPRSGVCHARLCAPCTSTKLHVGQPDGDSIFWASPWKDLHPPAHPNPTQQGSWHRARGRLAPGDVTTSPAGGRFGRAA